MDTKTRIGHMYLGLAGGLVILGTGLYAYVRFGNDPFLSISTGLLVMAVALYGLYQLKRQPRKSSNP